MFEKSISIIKKSSDKFTKQMKHETEFFKKPNSLSSSAISANIVISSFQELLKIKLLDFGLDAIDDVSLNSYLKSNKYSRMMFKYVANNNLSDFTYDKNSIGPVMAMVYFVSNEYSKLISVSEFPSNYRTKYIQKLSKMCLTALNHFGDKYQEVYKFLKKIDDLVEIVLLSSAIYIANRIKLQKKSAEVISENSCIDIVTANPIITKHILNAYANCYNDLDDVIVSKEPFEEKVKHMTCEVQISQQDIIITPASVKIDLTDKAIISSQTSKKMIITVLANESVTDNAIIGSIEEKPVYSPVNGVIESVEKNKIYIKNIYDSDNSFLSKTISSLNDLYQESNDNMEFIKKYDIRSLYPVMLAASSNIPVLLNTYDQFNSILKSYTSVNDDYTKNIKNITSKSNVEKHANNETTYIIKEDIDKQNNIILNWIKTINTTINDKGKLTSPLISEFSISSYYSSIVLELNQIKEPNKIQQSFRNELNGFISKRKIAANNTKNETSKEASFILNFFTNLYKRLNDIPNDISMLQKQLENLSVFSSYSIITENGQQYRNYSIAGNNVCNKSSFIDKSETDMNSINYWIKYCSFATLASVANPATGWSTGLILPTGPLLLPTVYIPIKPITTHYGFLLIGLAITGIVVSPMVLIANLSSEYALPFGDPVIALKNEVKALKTIVSDELKKFKKDVLKTYLDSISKQVNDKDSELSQAKQKLADNKLKKPHDKKLKEYAPWLEENSILSEIVLTLKIEKWKLEKKYQVVYTTYSTGSPLQEMSDTSLQNKEKYIDEIFNKITDKLNNIEKVVSTLPIALKPTTVAFGFTIKNPMPLINIATDLDDNVNEISLKSVASSFQLNNEDLMRENYENKLNTSAVNFDSFTKVLKSSNFLTISKDTFPSYERLLLTNLPWLLFLYKDLIPTGARTYGIPGFP